MARWPASGCRWQVQPAAHRPRPQPEMTTVSPASRILPIWKTDGLRLVLTGRSPRRLPGGEPDVPVRRDPDPARRCRHCGVRWWYASSSARYTAWLSTCAACDREKSSHGAGGATRWDENRRPAGTLTWRPGGSTMVGSVRLDVAAAWCREPGKKYDVEVWGTRSCCLERELQTP